MNTSTSNSIFLVCSDTTSSVLTSCRYWLVAWAAPPIGIIVTTNRWRYRHLDDQTDMQMEKLADTRRGDALTDRYVKTRDITKRKKVRVTQRLAAQYTPRACPATFTHSMAREKGNTRNYTSGHLLLLSVPTIKQAFSS